jgi:hypothetical protein
VLGKYRENDHRKGWISGLGEEEARKHPTIVGLRIGKPLPERRPEEPSDAILEWERDGQYYHYLTKWMHALNRVSQVTGNLIYNRWAIELAKTAHAAFTYTSSSGLRRMYWKMSIDLNRPLVTAMGQHDPLDGFITYSSLEAYAPGDPEWPSLKEEINDIEIILMGSELITHDPLGIGGILCHAYETAKLICKGYWNRTDLLFTLLGSAQISLRAFLKSNTLDSSADRRLAFRELGLSLGLRAVEKIHELVEMDPKLFDREEIHLIRNILTHTLLIDKIEGFWLKPENREAESWKRHRDINTVMLATSLAPDGYLGSEGC